MPTIYIYMPTLLHPKRPKDVVINLYYQQDKQFLAGKISWNFGLKRGITVLETKIYNANLLTYRV
jgi:hypothetical protein